MGNRAYVIFTNKNETEISPAVYLHWNGGPESIYAFLAELNRRQVRADQNYEVARFCQIVGEFFDGDSKLGGLSLGIVNGPASITAPNLEPFDDGDNGVYIVCREFIAPRVKRFIDYRFFSLEEVEREYREALHHKHNSGDDSIASVFIRRTNDRTIEA